MNNIFNYDILTNFRYADCFFYTQMSMRDPNDRDSEFVTKTLYLADKDKDTY